MMSEGRPLLVPEHLREAVTKAVGRGRMGGFAEGPGGKCVCPKCDYTEEHDTAEACSAKTCPKCGVKLTREGHEEETPPAA